MVKQILNFQYGIKELAIIDEIKANTSPLVTSLSKFNKTKLYDNAVILLTAYPPISKDLYNKLIDSYTPDCIVSIFDLNLNISTSEPLYKPIPSLPKKIQKKINVNTTKITFVGDLILLEGMVKAAHISENTYDFSKMFYYTEKYFKESDLNIGVLEGPVAPTKVYSRGNFADGNPVFLNYPLDFIKSIKSAGINLVTPCNNHLLDVGIDGVNETIDNLESIDLDYVGIYSNSTISKQKKQKIITINNIKIGIAAYTYGFNTISNDSFVKKYPGVAKILCPPTDKQYDKIRQEITLELMELKKNCDLLIVLPHMGKDFTHEISDYERKWVEVFNKAGADIILACHAHSVKPIELDKTLTCFCPGNYVNSFIDHDGDISIIVQIYIDNTTKDIIGCAIVPMIGITPIESPCYPIPIHDLMKSPLYTGPYYHKRSKEAATIASLSALGIKATEDIFTFSEKLFLIEGIVYREPLPPLKTDNSPIVKYISNYKKICFIGDSITAGSNNGGIPWYEPLPLDEKIIENISWGGATAKQMAKRNIAQDADTLSIIAIGCNDIRYHNADSCLNELEYYSSMKKIIENLHGEIIILSPWPSIDSDPYSFFDYKTKDTLYKKYIQQLYELTKIPRVHYLHIYDKLIQCMKTHNLNNLLVDHIHPNSQGIMEYCNMILNSDIE